MKLFEGPFTPHLCIIKSRQKWSNFNNNNLSKSLLFRSVSSIQQSQRHYNSSTSLSFFTGQISPAIFKRNFHRTISAGVPISFKQPSNELVPGSYFFSLKEFLEEIKLGTLNINGRVVDSAYNNTMFMHLLVYERQQEAAELLNQCMQLLKRQPKLSKLDANIKDINGRNVLMLAILTRAKDFIGLLLEADRDCLKQDFDLNTADNNNLLAEDSFEGIKTIGDTINGGFTALHYAFLLRDAKTAAKLIEKGADLTVKNLNGQTPFDLLNDENAIFKLLKTVGIDATRDAEANSNHLLDPTTFPFNSPIENNNSLIPAVKQAKAQLFNSWNKLFIRNMDGSITKIVDHPNSEIIKVYFEAQFNKYKGISLAQSLMNNTKVFKQIIERLLNFDSNLNKTLRP